MIEKNYATLSQAFTTTEWEAIHRVHLVPTSGRVALCGVVVIEGPASGLPWMPVYVHGQDIKKIAGEAYMWCTACEDSPDLPLALLGEL